MNNLAGVRFRRGDDAGAESLFRRALQVKEKILGAEHPDTALTAYNLGVLLQKTNRDEEAREQFARALRVFQARLGAEHPKTVAARQRIASKNETAY